jgi:TetR/AcrR family transcriptional regulator, transcriptional repressor for nem operon
MKTTGDERQKMRADILKAAAPILKTHGTHGAPVDEIMKAAGLTSGALYSHFKNKEDLCTQAIFVALDAMLERYRRLVRECGKDGLRHVVAEYLNEAHVGAVARGCPFVALGADMAKAGPLARRGYEQRVRALTDLFADGLPTGSPSERRAKAHFMLSSMIGALTLARSMNDPGAIGELLAQVRARVLFEID